MTVLSTDTCVRANQSGLGTASDGETYTINGGISTSISSNEAVVTGSSGFTSALLGTKTTADIDFTVRVKQINNNFDGVGPTWRSDATGANCYFVALYSGNILFAKLVSGGFTQIASVNISEVEGVFYQMHVTMIGNHLQARAWQDGTSEPGTWNIDTTDSTYAAAGRYGMSFNAFSGAGVEFDHITVTDAVTLANLATLAQGTFKVRAAMSAEARAAFKIRAMLASSVRATWKIRAVLVAAARASFGIRAVLNALARAAFKVRSAQSTPARATFKIQNAAIPSVPGIAAISDTAHGEASISDVLVDQARSSDVTIGSVTLSDQG